jgi:uncharacterized Fe-S radical SAM superfamily protein PflX
MRVCPLVSHCPAHEAFEYPELNRRITGKEYREAIKIAERYGLSRVYS